MTLDTMTKDEKSLLLYLETCAVDNTGLVDNRKMNADDLTIAKEWAEKGFIKFGRVKFESVQRFSNPGYTNWCELSEEAINLAQEERRARIKRLLAKRTWSRTDED